MSLLRPSGRLGFIVPSTFLKLDYGTRLRALLSNQRLVEAIVDFGHAQVFEGATNYTCIIVLDRSGRDELLFTPVGGNSAEVRRAVTAGDLPSPERYPAAGLSGRPWILVPSDERHILETMEEAGARLEDVTDQIFQGLITSADPIYILEDRGWAGSRRRVGTTAGEEIELERDLLYPLASGPDVERYAFRALDSLLLFPYRRDGKSMRLMTESELHALPRTWQYLCHHEAVLRARERGKMDVEGWWGYVYPKNLSAHDRPKLGVAATVKRLEVAADPRGEAYFHNVRVNGILPSADGPSIDTLVALLNSRAVDFAFRRGAAPLANGFFTANKQFIAWLPVPDDLPAELTTAGDRLHGLAAEIEAERRGFLDWIASVGSVRIRDLPGWTKLAAYDEVGLEGVLKVLDANSGILTFDPRSRGQRERIGAELERSASHVSQLTDGLGRLEREADVMVYESFGLSPAARSRIEEEYITVQR